MKKTFLLGILLFLGFLQSLQAQMVVGQDTLYGNEWIDHAQRYCKIAGNRGTRGIVKITYGELIAADTAFKSVNGSQLRMFSMGKEIPIYVSTTARLQINSFVEFYTTPQPAIIDQYLYRDTARSWLTPRFSWFQDATPYFITWSTPANVISNPPKRYETASNNMSLQPLPAKQEYYIAEAGNAFYGALYTRFTEGLAQNGDARLSGYEARGFAANDAYTITASDNITTNFVYAAGPAAQLTCRVKLYDENRTHDLRIKLNGVQYLQFQKVGYDLRNHVASIPTSALVASNTLRLDGNAGLYDYFSLTSATLKYPRQFNFENKTFYEFAVAANTNPTYYEITNFQHGNVAPILYDHTNGQRIETLLENGLIKFVLPPSSQGRGLTLRANNTPTSGYQAAEITTATPIGAVRLFPVRFRNHNLPVNQGNYIIISNRTLYSDLSGSNWVKAYAGYRKSTLGGGFDTLSVEINELYDQFAYGVGSPLSIRNFSHFAKKTFTGAKTPKYVFLIGKAYNDRLRRLGSAYSSLVPTYGSPASDNPMMGSNYTNVPIIPFGRLAAWNGEDVKSYLRKVQEQEQTHAGVNTQENKAWMKKVMHLIGAKDEPSIPIYMNSYKNIISSPSFGGEVYSFQKTNTDPVSSATSRILDSLLNTGVSIVNMFGHAYSQGTDFNLVPEAMENRGRYPLVMSLGCFSGDMFTQERALSERFVLAGDKAAIGFIGGVNLNLPPELNIFCTRFYTHLATDLYGKGIGDIMQRTIADNDLNNVVINQNMCFNGDPAIRLSPSAQPDFVVKENSIRLTPGQVTTLNTDFKVDFTVLNIGKSVTDSITISVTRTKPSGATTVKKLRVKAPPFHGNYSTIFTTGVDRVYGANSIRVCIDDPNFIVELDEMNNCATLDFQIYSNQLFPVYPPNFGIHPKNTVTLKAASSNPLNNSGNYIVEIATNEDFIGSTRSNNIPFSGGLLEYTVPNYTLTDSTVYYWRIKVSSDTIWQNSSFIYLKDETPGWNQSHYYQYKKDQFTNVQLPNQNSKFSFIDNNNEFALYLSHIPYGQNEVFQNGAGLFNMGPCIDGQVGGVFVLAVNPLTGETLNNRVLGSSAQGIVWNHGSYNCDGARSASGWFFVTRNNDGTGNAAGRDSLQRFLTQWVPNGYYVLAWTRGYYKSDDWSNSLFQAFEGQGATQIRATSGVQGPYAFFYQKNTPAFPVKEVRKGTNTPIVNEKFVIPGAWDRGGITSTLVGPAKEWGSFHWRTSGPQSAADVLNVDVYGVKDDKSETLLFPKLINRNQILTSVDAATFPYLKLKWNTKDSTLRTSANLDYWRVLFKQIPEAVLRPEKYLTFVEQADTTVGRGQTVTLKIAVENITATDMDSLRTQYYIYQAGIKVDSVAAKFGKLLGNSSINTTISYNTLRLEDRNNGRATCGVYVDVNPEIPASLHQQELHHFNNTGQMKFYVEQDNKNPLLDVTFDNQHIVNNDVVSSKPEILVTLKDENQYLALGDTSRFRLFLEYPPGTYNQNTQVVRLPVYLNQSNVSFHAANPGQLSKNNKAWLRFTPTFEFDGTYALFVQGKDAAENPSANQDFKVNFRIVNKSAISNVLNYPNPFTTSTKFVFTLTGSEVPSDMRIQIMTVTGKVVREVTKAELGIIHVGLNKTDFSWDGTDEFGDKLANGVYLYRVIARNAAGQDFDLINDRENGGNFSSYFQGGFGKMYLMR